MSEFTARYAWKITKLLSLDDVWEEGDEERYIGMGVNESFVGLFEDDTVVYWKVCDDDNTPYASGIMSGNWEGFEPLDDWATGDLGATMIYHRSKGNDPWELV